MCFPALAAIAPAISAISTVAGAGLSAIGAIQQSRAQAASLKAQAEYAERQREMELQKGGYEAGRANDQSTRAIDRMRGQYLSSGIALSGSVTDVIADSALEASLDEQAIKYGATVRADNLAFEAGLARANAKSVRQAGVMNALAPIIGAAGSLANQSIDRQRTKMLGPYQTAY